MLFFVRFDVKQPEAVPNADLVDIWRREAAAALGAVEAGAVKHLWKVAGQRVVLAVIDLPSPEDLDRALAGLPIIREMGAGVTRGRSRSTTTRPSPTTSTRAPTDRNRRRRKGSAKT